MTGHEDAAMDRTISLEFSTKPSAVRYMLGAFRPSPGLTESRPATRFRARWSGHRIEAQNVSTFLKLTGLPGDGGVSILYPHVFGFPLHMAILTHPEFPVPIWRILQTRNHLIQHRAIAKDATLDFEVCVPAQRILERGAEIDLQTSVRAGPDLAWESLVTFYTRGRFGDPEPASALAQSPEVRGDIVAQWRMPTGGSWQIGQFTGDHNGIHHSGWYARLFGFRSALYHPPVVLGQCLARVLPIVRGEVGRLDAWLKGPVYRGAHVALRAGTDRANGDCVLGLFMETEPRPCVVGRVGWRDLSSDRGAHAVPTLI